MKYIIAIAALLMAGCAPMRVAVAAPFEGYSPMYSVVITAECTVHPIDCAKDFQY